MIRFIHCMKARSDISLEAFRDFWHGADFNQQLSELAVIIGPRKIHRSLTLQVDANNQLQIERGARMPYDAVLEIWFDDAASLRQVTGQSEAQRLLKEMEALQAEYVDFSASTRFFTEWVDA